MKSCILLEGENVWDVIDQNRRLNEPFYLVQDKIQKQKKVVDLPITLGMSPLKTEVPEKLSIQSILNLGIG